MNRKTTPQGTEGQSEITLWDIARLLLRELHWVILAGASVGLIIFAAVSVLIAPTYESRVSFYVFNNTGSSQGGSINNSDLQAAESLAATYSKILTSNSVLDAVLNDLGADAGLTRKALSRMTNVSVVSGTQLLEVVVTSTDPQFACRVADSFAKTVPTEIVRITKAGGVEVVDRPEAATDKSSPRTLLDSMIGAVIGMIIMSVIIVIRELSDSTVYLPEDITSAADVTVLGQIPAIEPSGNTVQWELAEGGAVQYETNGKKSQNDK